jgi:hypothetical protein
MSRSPHRHRADADEVWRLLLFGEIVRAVDRPVTVRGGPTIRLPRSGRWESGLARVRPALDDALGATALAVAWRWACVEREELSWPGHALVAARATDCPVNVDPTLDVWARFDGGGEIVDGPAEWSWRLEVDGGRGGGIGVRGLPDIDWSAVDRTADVLAAWLDRPWHVG